MGRIERLRRSGQHRGPDTHAIDRCRPSGTGCWGTAASAPPRSSSAAGACGCSRAAIARELGEIDLIARDGETLVFVEVKARRQGVPAEAVTPEKQRRITLTALHFLRKHGLLDVRSRFDVIAIIWPDQRGEPKIDHFVNAFEAVGRGQIFR